jgi:hypothetical protein
MAMASPADFVVVSDGCGGKTLLLGDSCAVQIAFRPASAGVKTGTIVLLAGPAGQAMGSLLGTGL